jgi:hypothetical protein
MINAWHLVWIIPVSGMVGVVAAALCAASNDFTCRGDHDTQ